MKKNDCTDFNDFAEDLTEAHGEGIRFLLEQVTAGLSPFQTRLHDGLCPASRQTHSLVELFTPHTVVMNTRNNRTQCIGFLLRLRKQTLHRNWSALC